MSNKENGLSGFNGWDNKVPDNFFDDSPEDLLKTDASSVVEEVLKDDEVQEEQEPEKQKTEEELADELFNDDFEQSGADTEDIDDENEDNDETDKKSKQPFKGKGTSVAALNLLKEKGYIEFDLDEGEELTEELAEEILEDKFDESIENRIEELFSELPDVVKQLNKYALQGGDVSKFLGTITKQNQVGITADLDLETESNQELVVKAMLKEQGFDDEYIDTNLEFLKDSGKLKMTAEKQFGVWKTNNQKQQEAILKQQEETIRKNKENIRKEKAKLSTLLGEVDEVKGLKLSKIDKKELPSYILDRNLKMENGSVISAFHKDIMEAMSNETTAIQLAKLLRGRNKDGSFNFKEIETITKTKVAQEVRENIRRNKTNTPKASVSSQGSSQKKELADYF